MAHGPSVRFVNRADVVAALAEDGLTGEDIALVLNIRHLCEAGQALCEQNSVFYQMFGEIAKRYGVIPVLMVDALGEPIAPPIIGDVLSTKLRALYARDIFRREQKKLSPRTFKDYLKDAWGLY